MSWISLGHLGSSKALLSCTNILVCWHFLFIFIYCRLNQHWSEGKLWTRFSSLVSSEQSLNTSPSKSFSSTCIPSRMPPFPKETATHRCKLHPPKGCIHQFSLLSTHSGIFSAFSTACWSSVGRKNKYELWYNAIGSKILNTIPSPGISLMIFLVHTNPDLQSPSYFKLGCSIEWSSFFCCGQVSTKDHSPDTYISEFFKMGTPSRWGPSK